MPSKGEWINQSQECKKENNPLENGFVFIWTETKGTGHAFVSVHEGNSASVFTYGRFGRRSGIVGAVGDGILNFCSLKMPEHITEKSCTQMEAKAFIITDADPTIARMYLEKLWRSGGKGKGKKTSIMRDSTKRNGHTIDQYDCDRGVTVQPMQQKVKIAGSQIFEGGYTTHSQIRIDYEEDLPCQYRYSGI
ncbi:hypothetical protein [Pectobacterium brasiliense]|uniref:hypothetical protein n=1 Tax=Pectobacterium brasiliense TaxID=180957 RepID=UPI001F078A3E|nr:hypothetical protein [Pectobacterium brasiliense]